MTPIQIEDLARDLRSLLNRVRAGERLLVEDDEGPMAILSPPLTGLARTDAEGSPHREGIRAPKKRMTVEERKEFLAVPRPKVSDEAVREALAWARDDR